VKQEGPAYLSETSEGIKMLNYMHTRFKVMNTRKETDLYEQFACFRINVRENRRGNQQYFTAEKNIIHITGVKQL
jgi:hypothetical protein